MREIEYSHIRRYALIIGITVLNVHYRNETSLLYCWDRSIVLW